MARRALSSLFSRLGIRLGWTDVAGLGISIVYHDDFCSRMYKGNLNTHSFDTDIIQ